MTHLIASSKLGIGYVLQLSFQMIYFIILTRMLGPAVFGLFAASLAAINVLSPFAGFGYSEVAFFRVSQDSEQVGLWGRQALVMIAVLGTIVSLALTFVAAIFDSVAWVDAPLMLGLAMSELVGVRVGAAIGSIFRARDQMGRASAINVGTAAIKMLVAGTLFATGVLSLAWLIILLDIAFAAFAIYLIAFLRREVKLLGFRFSSIREEFRLACSFAVSIFSKAIYTDLDKLLLAKWSDAETVGTYAAGYKMLSLSFMPMRAILEATTPKCIRLASQSPKECAKFTGKIFAATMCLALAVSLGIWMLAPFVTWILGNEYSDTIGILSVGFALPILQTVHYNLGNYLTAMDFQATRTKIQLVVLSIYVCVSMIVIPIYGMLGAIMTSLASESLLGLLFALACIHVYRKRVGLLLA